MLDLVGAHPEARVDRSRRGPDPGNSVHHMNFAPARTAMWAMSDRTRYMRHVSFTFGDEAVRELLDEEIDSSAFVPSSCLLGGGRHEWRSRIRRTYVDE